MNRNILEELDKAMKSRRLKVPAVAKKTGIPADRIYKWYQQGTNPKTEDSLSIWKWINGEMDVEEAIVEEPQADYKTKYIELLERTLQEKEQRIKELEQRNEVGGEQKKASA